MSARSPVGIWSWATIATPPSTSGIWRWNAKPYPEGGGLATLFYDEEYHTWWSLADGGPGSGTLFFAASRPEHRYGHVQLHVEMRWDLSIKVWAPLASGRIDVDRDGERRGLAMSAHEQARRLGVDITLAELRALLDAFIADVLSTPLPAGGDLASQYGNRPGTVPL